MINTRRVRGRRRLRFRDFDEMLADVRLLLNVAVPAGIRPPAAVRREFMFDHAEFGEALGWLESGVERLGTETHRVVHPLLGRLTPAQWDKFHLRHSEMHLGFIVPE